MSQPKLWIMGFEEGKKKGRQEAIAEFLDDLKNNIWCENVIEKWEARQND